ncbi:homeobox and leucine zipper encoding b [Thunnus maccoyii]|uniref:homeobox and leucine zipper encoding b n=1 Tax=Thunnus maccoyii TaxID=8240 RepID=UPI001C4CB9BF|nr:homeobox and leucine zipper encoding b [Thunnus maccoyii]XP_042257268.1 homeobox and leucine zipper encoding b [Thunnus maccoyii]XP_042257269.1 homeobox and leucine zipper encoding b [Thunnus maccoyii]XP_042257270.1 homeobox and leucine zipper encoding b [Thunnus maccoyii]
MTKMRQTANGELRQKTPDAHGETPTISEMNFAPAAFNLNQSSAVCLPLVSESRRLIWVNSNQINLQLDGAAELDKAFDRFPYLTQKQTAELAQRCSLHPDQVKVWFMLQRLRYGISWDYKDIREVRAKFKRRKEEQQEVDEDRREKEKQETEMKESGGNKAGDVREEDVCANEREMKQQLKREKDRKVEKVEEDKKNTQKKRKKMTVTDNMGKKGTKQQEEGAGGVEIINVSVTPANSGFEGKPEMEARPGGELHAESTNYDFAVTDVVKLKHIINNNQSPRGSTHSPDIPKKQKVSKEPYTLPTPRIRWRTKTQTQLVMMKEAFSHCQYPDSEHYDLLATRIGVPRYVLVQWFGDMRYYIKRGKPGWLNEEQHSKALANIKYRQFLKALAKEQSSEGEQKATMKMKLEGGKSYGDGEMMQVPSE